MATPEVHRQMSDRLLAHGRELRQAAKEARERSAALRGTSSIRRGRLPRAERDARRLAQWHLRQPYPRPTVLNARVLRRMANGPGIPTAARIDAALAELAELAWTRPAPARQGGSLGRQRGDWAINPAVLEAEP